MNRQWIIGNLNVIYLGNLNVTYLGNLNVIYHNLNLM